MKWFNRNKAENKSGDKLAERLAGYIMAAQESFVRFMTSRTKKYSVTQLKWLLLFFILAGTILSTCIALHPFGEKQGLGIDHMTGPHLSNEEELPPRELLSKEAYERLQSFEIYIDSLRRIRSPLYDSIMKNRAGLVDSIKLLESFYQNQLQKQK